MVQRKHSFLCLVLKSHFAIFVDLFKVFLCDLYLLCHLFLRSMLVLYINAAAHENVSRLLSPAFFSILFYSILFKELPRHFILIKSLVQKSDKQS
jgi:hypothetical protein